MSKVGSKESELRAKATEIATSEGLSIEAGMKVASAVYPELAAAARDEEAIRIEASPGRARADHDLTAELVDRTKQLERTLGLSFADAYARASEENAHRLGSDTASASILVSIGTARAQERGIELGVALDELRVVTPKLWRKAVGG